MQHPDITRLDAEQADACIGLEGHPGSRYFYDRYLSEAKGWEAYDTRDDAWYFGMWVNVSKRQIFTYAEGDRYVECCASEESFVALLSQYAQRYGKAPPFMVTYDCESGVRTEHYCARPGDALLAA